MEHALQGCAINMFYLGCGETLIMDPIIDLVRKVTCRSKEVKLSHHGHAVGFYVLELYRLIREQENSLLVLVIRTSLFFFIPAVKHSTTQ